jgi:hypothetical protein
VPAARLWQPAQRENSGTCCRIYLGESMIREKAGIEVRAPAFGDT